jgi:hypothetical protein
MPSISKELRNQLARATLAARTASEDACRAALENLAVHEKEYRPHMSVDQRLLRNRLRARGRALGDERDAAKQTQEIKRLTEDAAYEQWHRLLFTRFLAENNLLHTDDEQGNVPVTLADCDELAPELGAKDGFDLACRFSSRTLPGIFRSDDPIFDLPIAQRDQVELKRILDSLPAEVFTADDSLGWTYQFWQAQRKDEVNASGKKIGAEEISPVTQLFTEDYMVEFLLHNTLGAWWAGKLGPIVSADEAGARAKAALPVRDGIGVTWTYLRFIQDEATKTWKPAAGTFGGWPKTAAEIKFLDPCMGSGHFPVFALPLLARLRMEEEKLSATVAIHAVLRDNIHGLELDPRCCQIGAFNLALTAWKHGGYRALPPLHVACCGLAPAAQLKDWVALAGENQKLQRGMEKLHSLFKNAPVLGSLINPRAGEGDLLVAAYHELQPLMEKALTQETKDDTAHEMAVTARGLAKAAEILGGQFTLVATNVPFLGRRKQDSSLATFCENSYPLSKADLATCFLERCLSFCSPDASVAVVLPQNPLFLGSFKDLRAKLLKTAEWNIVARLGEHGFESTAAAGGFTALISLKNRLPTQAHDCACAVDVAAQRGEQPIYAEEKSRLLKAKPLVNFRQAALLKNPDATIIFGEVSNLPLLLNYAESLQGCGLADIVIFRKLFWEIERLGNGWVAHQSSPDGVGLYTGLHFAVKWDDGNGALANSPEATIRGRSAWGKNGIACAWLGRLPAGLYLGTLFDNSAAAIVPKNPSHLGAIWCFVSAPEFLREVRKINQKTQVANATLVKVPFDLAHWQKVAAEKYPHGLPKPFSSDPTQWLFNGHPAGAEQPLHVAVARLLGYHWPRQTGSSFPDSPALGSDGLETLADDDGIVCLPAINREQPAAARLRALLAAALGSFDERKLLAATGAKPTTLEDWLRDEFFEQHAKLFHQRPFLWHVWDGRKDGFSAIVNYHKLDHATLQKLTYTYLGNWIHTQESDAKADKPGAAERLGAAQALQAELVKILEGEAPYDIFIRWKPLKAQAIGWNPDLNDGVRLNIRPFLTAKDLGKRGAGILRSKPNIKWDKDRGKEPQRPKSDYPWFWCDNEPSTDPEGGKAPVGNRWNDVHLTLEFKKAVHPS